MTTKQMLVKQGAFIWLVAILFVFACAAAVAQDVACVDEKLPITISLDGDWDFFYKPKFSWANEEQNIPALPDEKNFAAKMPVPGYWDDELDRMRMSKGSYKFWSSARFKLNRLHGADFPVPREDWPPPEPWLSRIQYLEGVGFYKKSIEFPENWQDKTIILHVGGVRIEAWAWVNGEYLGYRLGGMSFPLEWSFADKIKPGEKNEIVIAISNLKKVGGCDTWNDQNFGAGITRSVHLKVSGKGRIENLYAYPRQENTKLNWNVEVDGDYSGATLDWAVEEPLTGKVLGSGSTAVKDKSVTWTTDTFGMRPWSDHDPSLYDLKVDLVKDGKNIDSVDQRFGLRTIVRDGIGLRLNGRPVMLRGALCVYGYAVTKRSPSDVNYHRMVIRNLKEIGFNWIRTHTWVPNEEYLQAADELGMMFQVEQSGGYNEKEWIEILKHCRKHPSVVLYCYGNESLLDDKLIEFLRKRGEEVRQYAPDALYDPMEALRGIEYYYEISNMGTDYVETDWSPGGERPALHNPRRLEEFKSFADVLASLSWSMLSYDVQGGNWKELDRRYELLKYDRPILTHELGMQGQYMDLSLRWRYEGTKVGANPHEYELAFQEIRKAGLLQRAHTFYVNSCKVTATSRKWCLENARKSRYTAGYDYHTLRDCHLNQSAFTTGILNEFHELKAGEMPDDVLKYNGESVVLIDHSHDRNLYSGEAVEYDVMSSLYGAGPLTEGKLIWTLRDSEGRVHDSGDIALNNIPNGAVHKLGKISFAGPDVLKGTKLSLRLRIIGGEYDIENDWDHWVFPKMEAPPVTAAADNTILQRYGNRYKSLVPIEGSKDQLRVLSDLNPQALAFIASGGNVVLLGSGPFATQPCGIPALNACIGLHYSPNATVVNDHPVTNGLPHDGYLGWESYSMYNPSPGVDFTDTDLPFDPIIEIAHGFKIIRKVANLFEMRIGAGKLLVCTLNFPLSDPAAVSTLDSIMRYASSEDFKLDPLPKFGTC